MAYRIKSDDASVEEAVRRIAREQIGKAIKSIDKRHHAEAVHDVRKRCKKLRGLVRLVRPSFPGYGVANTEFRDIASLLSGARDARVMQDTYDRLVERYAAQIDRKALSSIRRGFTLQRKAVSEDQSTGERLAQARERLVAMRLAVDGWTLDTDGAAAVTGGLAKTCKRARKARDTARGEPDAANFHELRKRIKYHMFHARLLEDLWPELLAVRINAARELSDLLGDHHDLAVFIATLEEDPSPFGDPLAIETATGLARSLQQDIEAQAWPVVDRLLAQGPGDLADHVEALWRVWRPD